MRCAGFICTTGSNRTKSRFCSAQKFLLLRSALFLECSRSVAPGQTSQFYPRQIFFVDNYLGHGQYEISVMYFTILVVWARLTNYLIVGCLHVCIG